MLRIYWRNIDQITWKTNVHFRHEKTTRDVVSWTLIGKGLEQLPFWELATWRNEISDTKDHCRKTNSDTFKASMLHGGKKFYAYTSLEKKKVLEYERVKIFMPIPNYPPPSKVKRSTPNSRKCPFYWNFVQTFTFLTSHKGMTTGKNQIFGKYKATLFRLPEWLHFF